LCAFFRDKLKKELCEKHGIKMIYIDYDKDVFKQIGEKLINGYGL